MRTSDVLEYFGGRPGDADTNTAAIKAIADALGIKAPSVYGWGDVVPPLRQLQLERISGGALKPDPSLVFETEEPPARQQASASHKRGQFQ